MITDKDTKIVRHVEKYGFITIKQAEDLCYNNLAYGYSYARQRFKQLIDLDYLKVYRSPIVNRNIYYIDDEFKNPKPHKILVMDYYCKLIGHGVNMEYFKKEFEWCNGEVRSDAFAIYTLGDTRFYNVLEVNTSNNILNLEKYIKIIDDFSNKYNESVLPTIILIDKIERNIDNINNKFKVIPITYSFNYQLKNFAKIFI